jgi:4'-phosphopantetheinyl transferase EntD
VLPASAATAEEFGDLAAVELFPEERACVDGAVEKRRREFATARACAHRAIERLGLPRQPIGRRSAGEPRWPAGVVGSITHCQGYRACAVAHASDLAMLGIDAEPNAALPAGVLTAIATDAELAHVRSLSRDLPSVPWDRLLFSAKECVYKACFPYVRRLLDFDAAVLTFDASASTFSARLRVSVPLPGPERLQTLSGRWLAREDLLLTGMALERA